MKKVLYFFCVVLFTGSYVLFTSSVRADEFDDLQKKIDDLTRSFEMSRAATTPLEITLTNLEKQIATIRAKIAVLEKEVQKKEEEVATGEKVLTLKNEILETRVRSLYINNYHSDNIVYQLLFSRNLSEDIRAIGYQKRLLDDDKSTIADIAVYVKDLELKKEALAREKGQLASAKIEIDKQAEFFRKEIKGAKDYQRSLNKEIAELTARQQAILAAKVGLFSTSVGSVPLADDPASRPDYNPGFSPAFAAFSFGAPHFKGMSQYGAFGRAKDGRNYRQILEAYYGNVELRKMGMPGEINTSAGRLSFEGRYLKGIAEMPTQWADEGGYEALKAQAVAARSYALAYVGWRIGNQNAGGSICVTEACQVYTNHKADNPGRWADAVRETEGEILVSKNANEIVNTLYASTSGGYQESYSSLGHTTFGIWDTKNGRDGWTNDAYEKIAGSPWFYKGWYKTRSGINCNRSHPWLTKEEFADIVNAAVVYQANGDISGIFPEDVRSCFGGSDSPWSKDRLREEANKHGGGFTSVSTVSVQYSTGGVTAKVIVDGREFDGQKFYQAFNLRAPGAIHLKSGLFNFEKK